MAKELSDYTRLSSLYLFIASTVIVYSLVDIPRRSMGGAWSVLLLIDLTILLTYASYLKIFYKSRHFFDGLSFMPVEMKLFLIGLVFVLFSSLIYPVHESALLNAMAFRTYILPIPMLLIGYHFFSSWSDLSVVRGVERFTLLLGVSIATIAFIQLGLKQRGIDFLPPLEHEYRSFYSSQIDLISSVFSSSKKYGRFMFFVMALYFLSRSLQGKSFGLAGIYLLASILISGSREALVIAILFLVLAIGIGGEQLKQKSHRTLKLNRALKLLISVTFLALTLTTLAPFSDRLQYFLAADDSLNFIRRIVQFLPLFAINTDPRVLLSGIGAARYGQESQLVPELRANVEGMTDSLFGSDLVIGSEALAFSDSGLTKIIIELGIGGLLVWMLLLFFMFYRVLPAILGNHRSVFQYSLAYMLFAWLVFFLKAHPVLSDFLMSSLFYLLLGGFVFAYKTNNSKRRNQYYALTGTNRSSQKSMTGDQ